MRRERVGGTSRRGIGAGNEHRGIGAGFGGLGIGGGAEPRGIGAGTEPRGIGAGTERLGIGARSARRGVYAAASALLALSAAQGIGAVPAAADDGTPGAGSGAPAAWQPQGKPLAGAATTADAPAMTSGETYRDTIKPGETRMYGITLDAKSSAYASAFALPPADGRVAYGDGIELKLMSADGDDCDSQEAHFGDDGAVRPVGTAVTRTIDKDESSCQEANQYTLAVHRTSDGSSDPGAWPLELRFVLEPALTTGADGGHVAATQSASPRPLTSGTPRQAAGGTSFATAAAVKTGIWKDKVLPGETRFYKVPVDWGQQATVFTDFSSAKLVGDSAYVGSGVRLAAYNPVRALIDGDTHSYDGTQTSVHEQLAPVAYGNRAADDRDVARVRFAGWYYFAVTVHPDVAQAVSGPVGVTLRVDVRGGAQAGPDYAGDARAAGIGVDAHDVASADGAPQSAASGDGGGESVRRFLGFAAFGAGTVLVLGLGAWWLAARRRPVAQDAVTQQLPPQSGGFGPPPSSW